MRFQISIVLALVLSVNLAFAEKKHKKHQYQISITNITKGQTFTPQFVSSHRGTISLFTLGEPANEALELLAEGGSTALMISDFLDVPSTGSAFEVDGLLGPGETTTFTISGHPRHHRISIAAMLIPTNDAFVALNAVVLPKHDSVTYFAKAYDAGTEENDQKCLNIPGPRCKGDGHSVENDADEGFVYVSNGFHDLGDMDDEGNEILGPLVYDWRNPVAKITITRMNKN